MQVAGDPDPLGLLRCEHPAAALVSLALEPVEHLVEGRDDAADLVAAPTGRRWPGRSRSTVSMCRASRSSGMKERLNRRALATTVIASPPRTINACVVLIGELISTGLTSRSTAIAPRSPALTAKTRQKSDRRIR